MMQIVDLSGLYYDAVVVFLWKYFTLYKLALDILCAMILAGLDIINQFCFIFNWQPSLYLIIGLDQFQCKLLRNENYNGFQSSLETKKFRQKSKRLRCPIKFKAYISI